MDMTDRLARRGDRELPCHPQAPVFPHLWPQCDDRNTQLAPGSPWQSILNDILATTANGAVIWGGQNPAVACNSRNGGAGVWVGVTQTFLGSVGNRS